MYIFNHTETKGRGHEVPPDCPSVSIDEFMKKTNLSPYHVEAHSEIERELAGDRREGMDSSGVVRKEI